uniref:SONA homologue, putative n=1 Tax=Theileria annulata TaxID=5874 RepID=A0A3B0N5X0_THEAN
MSFSRTTFDDQPQKYMLNNLPNDSISHLRWSTTTNPLLLTAGSWDKTLRIWKINTGLGNAINTDMVCSFKQDAPVLCSAFSADSMRLFGGGCTNNVLTYDLNNPSGAGVIIARHQKPVNGVHWIPQFNLLLSTSWDGFVNLWDGRQEQPVWSENLNSKVFASDVKDNIMCVADSNRKLNVWSLEKLQHSNSKITIDSSLKLQIRALSLFPDTKVRSGVAYSSIGGRCVVNYFTEDEKKNNFSFKCHRQDQPGKGTFTYSVNAIDFHTVYGTFVSGGGDGTFTIWDKDNKSRVKAFSNVGAPVVDVKFMSEGNLLAYATSYDWYKGLNHSLISNTNKSIGIIKVLFAQFSTTPPNSF